MECDHLDKVCVKDQMPDCRVGSAPVCAECSASSSVWMCLSCGVLSCGRYVNAHALQHKEKTKTHSVCIETKELSVYCYDCDEFVINDTADRYIEKVREKLSVQSESSPLTNGAAAAAAGLSPASYGRSLRPRKKRNGLSPGVGGAEPKKQKRSPPQPPPPPAQKTTKKNSNPKKRLGLKNLGNTCFMNSVLQSLCNIEEFSNILTALPSLEHQLNTSKDVKSAISHLSAGGIIMTEELKKVLRALKDGVETSAISPDSLFHAIWKVVPRFRGYQQQDAHEFLRYMLDRLHTELLLLLPSRFRNDRIEEVLRGAPLTKSQSVVTSVFGGTLQSEVTCLSCRATSNKQDPFLDLSVDIPQQFTGNS